MNEQCAACGYVDSELGDRIQLVATSRTVPPIARILERPALMVVSDELKATLEAIGGPDALAYREVEVELPR